MKKAIIQLSTAILGVGDTCEEALEDWYDTIAQHDVAGNRLPISDDDLVELVPLRGALAGECVCVDITDELAANPSTDYFEVEDGVAVKTDPSEY